MTAQQLIDQAEAHFAANLKDEAVAVLQRAVEIEPDNGMAWWNLALKQRWSGRIAESEPSFKSAIRLMPRAPRLWAHYASMLQAADRLDDAQRAVEQAERLNSDDEKVDRIAAAVYGAKKGWARQAAAIQRIRTAGKATEVDINQ